MDTQRYIILKKKIYFITLDVIFKILVLKLGYVLKPR